MRGRLLAHEPASAPHLGPLLARGEREGKRQSACKPGSVREGSLPPRRPFIWGVRRRTPRATNPGGGLKTGPGSGIAPAAAAAPIRSCSRWGLPCHPCCQGRGALLPHPFTLALWAKPVGRFAFCCTFPGVAPAGRYPAPCLHGARTFLRDALTAIDATARPAAVQPTGEGEIRGRGGGKSRSQTRRW